MAKKPGKPKGRAKPRRAPVTAPVAASSSTADTRNPDGTFRDGNPGGPGGARPGSGRKPKEVRDAYELYLQSIDGKIQTGITELLDSKAITPKTKAALLLKLLEHRKGRATIHMELTDATDRVDDLLDAMDLRRIARAGAKKGRDSDSAND